MARPTKNEHEKKTSVLSVRVTTAERVHAETQAELAGLPLSEYMHSRVTGHQVTPRKTKLEASFLVELNRLGVNLNQIARARNTGREDPAILQFVLDELHQLMAKVGAAL